MVLGFERGRSYNRRTDIHERFEGQRQGGIITPSGYPVIIIITGEEGLAHGYHDRTRPDGAFEYFGEGQVGDMTFVRGNRAIRDHSANGRDLLLFRKMKDGSLRYEGPMVYEGHHIERAPDRTKAMRDAIVFELRPLEAVAEEVEQVPPAPTPGTGLSALRTLAMDAAQATPGKRGQVVSVFERSRRVRDYVVLRAGGLCEGCAAPAPFLRPSGAPYLEPHHIRRLSDGGPDDPHFVIALCPNCHRRVHSGADGPTYNSVLLGKMASIEPKP